MQWGETLPENGLAPHITQRARDARDYLRDILDRNSEPA